MQKLDPHGQIPITKENIEHILKAYAVSDFTWKPINEGIANTSLRIESGGKEYVLRVYAQGRKSDGEISFELSFQDYLREHGMPIPLIYKNAEGKELTLVDVAGKRWQVILMHFVEGQSVTARHTPELISELASLQARMHLLGIEFAKNADEPKKPWKDLRDSFAKEIKDPASHGQDVVAFIERVKSFRYPLNPKLPSGYNHLDIDLDGNVIVKDNGVAGIIDFDDLAYSPCIVCLGFSLWNILDDEGIGPMKGYLKEYEKIRPLTPLEREALPHVIFFRNYAIGVIRLFLWEETTDRADIEGILKLEKEIPLLYSKHV